MKLLYHITVPLVLAGVIVTAFTPAIVNEKRCQASSPEGWYAYPQILRHHGVLAYEPPLAKRVDAKQELAQGSREELEIRAATIWACEMLAAKLKQPACVIDNALWVLSQEAGESLAPYHRTRTTNY